VNLIAYKETAVLNLWIYWIMFLILIAAGVLKIIFMQLEVEKWQNLITGFSMGVNILAVLFLALAREAYVVRMAFLLLVIKGILILKVIKTGK
jgi:hypothetical protein